jgi:small conductance mechanosensitive channel
MHFTHPFRTGHLIQVGNFMGCVDTLELRATKMRTQQGQSVIIPNSKIMENEIANYSITGERRVDIKCGVSYGADLQQAEDLAIKAVESLERRKPGRAVELFYEDFGESSINFTLRFWTDPDQKTHLMARSPAIKAIKQTFNDHWITIPFPIRTLDFAIVGGESLREQLQGVGRQLSTPQETKSVEKAAEEQKGTEHKSCRPDL